MRLQELVEVVADEPVFETGLLLAGAVDPGSLRRQLSRWTRSGRIRQLRRGLYTLTPQWEKRPPHHSRNAGSIEGRDDLLVHPLQIFDRVRSVTYSFSAAIAVSSSSPAGLAFATVLLCRAALPCRCCG
ncbi:MAG: hypothetical protein OXH96_19035 [Spirochaetaceae bacterium]|nr:hypothetical protein [Spirochaetaceae bacterium]